MKRLISMLILAILVQGNAEIPDVIIHDLDGSTYDVHELLDEGHYIVFYMLSKT